MYLLAVGNVVKTIHSHDNFSLDVTITKQEG